MINSPFMQEFVSLRNAMDQLVNESFTRFPYRTVWSRSGGTANGNGAVYPLPLDVYATDDEAVIVAAIPGVDPANLEVTFQQGTVTLAGQIPNVAESGEAKGATWYVHELWSGTFRRTVGLPFEIDAGKAEATFEHGLLKIVLPKAEQVRPQKIAVRAGTGAEAITAGSASQK